MSYRCFTPSPRLAATRSGARTPTHPPHLHIETNAKNALRYEFVGCVVLGATIFLRRILRVAAKHAPVLTSRHRSKSIPICFSLATSPLARIKLDRQQLILVLHGIALV